jgi:hypothetical protein
MPKEEVTIGRLSDVENWDIHEDYFSISVIKENAK